MWRPILAAISPWEGRTSVSPSSNTSTGSSVSSSPAAVISRRASGSAMSSQRYGTPFRATKSRAACDSAENRCPTSRRPGSASRAAESASQSSRRSSSTGYSRASGGLQGFIR